MPSNLQEPSDPLDLNDNGDADENNCVASASLTIPPVSGPAKYAVTKTVQGDLDAAPRPFPGVGVVSEDGGTAEFGLGWKNTGGTTLKGAVLYDIFPRVGDFGVGADFAKKPRNSKFTPTYAGFDNPDPSHLTVAFTRSHQPVPCRGLRRQPGLRRRLDDHGAHAGGVRRDHRHAHRVGQGLHAGPGLPGQRST